MLFHLLVEAVLLNELYPVCQIRDLLRGIRTGYKTGICIFHYVVVLLVILQEFAILLRYQRTAVREVVFKDFQQRTDLFSSACPA